MTSFERLLVATVAFYGGFSFCLPVAPDEFITFPWWATRIDIGKVVLHEVMFIVWLVFFGAKRLPGILNQGDTVAWRASNLLALLAIWCGIVSLMFSPLPGEDLGRSLRLVLYALMLLAVIDWTQRARHFVLLALICGFAAGTLINLEISSTLSETVVGGARRLAGQNTPGVGMGIAMHTTAWLFFLSDRPIVKLIAFATALLCGYGCGISFSRVGWLTGGAGLLAWIWLGVYGQHTDANVLRNAKRIAQGFAFLVVMSLFSTLFAPVQNALWDIIEVFRQKDWVESQSNDYRFAYFSGVAEIIFSYPLGVGYSGFYDAMINTEVYESGRASLEDGFDANPHSGFLYYASAGGSIGLILCMVIFYYLVRCFRVGFHTIFGRPGKVIYYLVSFGYVFVGLTVPYMYNSSIMVVPAGIALGLAILQSRSTQQ
jgi:hypothetical protein